MEFKKRKDGTYLLVKLDKVDASYLKDFKKYEPKRHVKDTDKLFSHLFALHVQAVYIMSYCDMLKQDGIVSEKLMNIIRSELEKDTLLYSKTIEKYINKLHALDAKQRKKTVARKR